MQKKLAEGGALPFCGKFYDSRFKPLNTSTNRDAIASRISKGRCFFFSFAQNARDVQRLIFMALAVNSSRICFDSAGHLMEGEMWGLN